jgi:hypothetical protein
MFLFYKPVCACCKISQDMADSAPTNPKNVSIISIFKAHNALTLISHLHSCPGTHCQHHHRDNSDDKDSGDEVAMTQPRLVMTQPHHNNNNCEALMKQRR